MTTYNKQSKLVHNQKPTIYIAGFGHRFAKITPAIKAKIKQILVRYKKVANVIVLTNFALGADLAINECAFQLGIRYKAIIPFKKDKYLSSVVKDAKANNIKFTKDDELKFKQLLSSAYACKVIEDTKYPYLAASKYIISKANKVIALWDGIKIPLKGKNNKPINVGGTWYSINNILHSKRFKKADLNIIKCKRK